MNAGSGFVQYVDRLVRKVAVGNVAPGQGDAGPQCFVRVAHSVVPFVVRRDVAQDLQGFLFRSGFDEDFLKAAFQRGIALDIFAIFVQRRGADDLQFAPRQGGFENVGRVEASLGRTCARDGVYFVDEENRVLLPAQFFEKSLHSFFELTSVFGPGHERRYVERVEPLAADSGGNFVRCHPQGQPFDDGALAHAGFADQDRVVLLAARKDLHDAFDLPLTSYDGIDAASASFVRKVGTEFVQQGRLRRRNIPDRFVQADEP